MSKLDYEKYQKREKCSYPFEPSMAGYCWGYANAVDDKMKIDEFEETVCKDCEFYEEEE